MNRSQANSVFSPNVVSIPTASNRLVVYEPKHDWRAAVLKRMEQLVRLDRGWDGYDGRPVSLENAAFALRMLEAVCRPQVLPPQLVPGSSGDIQIEWHTLKGDIELHVLAPNRVKAWRHLTEGAEDGECLDLTIDFGTVANWVREITEPDLAAATAAA